METIPGHLQRLPAGGDRYKAEMLSRSPRERILAAMAEIVAKRGYQGTSVELIVKRAGLARATFYENFENREACLLAGFEEALEECRRRVEEAAAGEPDWESEISAGIAVFLAWVEENPALARTCLVELNTAGPEAMERYQRALQSFAPAFARGRELTDDSDELPGTLEDSIVGGIAWMVHQRLVRGEAEQVPGLRGTMLEFALAPYLGEERAAAVAARA